jgi:signal transduction histidine kinase
MIPFFYKVPQLFRINFLASDFDLLSSDDIRRIKMVNIIGLIGIANLSLYALIYSFIDFRAYIIPITFYFTFIILTLGIIAINKYRYFALAKILVVIISPLYLALNSTLLFGKAAGSQVYILAFSIIPLFVWGFKEKGNIYFFIILDLLVYAVIDFLPPFTEPRIGIPSTYVDFFKSLNVFIAFFVVAIASIVFQRFSFQKEEQLVKQAIELKKSQKHRDLVYSIIAHDLRGPFSGLMGISGLLLKQFETFDNEKKLKLIASINTSSISLNNLLENLLDWSNIQKGGTQPMLEKINLHHLSSDILELLADMLNQKELNSFMEIKPETYVVADIRMVSTILRNLIGNAIKFSPNGGIITISARTSGNFTEICVADFGVGIPTDKMDELLMESSRYHTNGTNNEKGSGLGLIICNDFVSANGGKMWIESKSDIGTKVFFTLTTAY